MEAKMDCARASDLLSLYIDGMLDETQAHDLQLHLDACAICAAEYEQLARMRAALLSVPEVPLPAGFDDRFRKSLTRVTHSPRPRRRARVWASAAAVFTLGLLSMFVYRNIEGYVFYFGAPGGAAPASAGDSAKIAQSEEYMDYSAEDAGGFAEESAEIPSAEDIGDAAQESAGTPPLYSGYVTTEVLPSYEGYDRFGYPARGTTSSAHRINEKAMYDEMLEEKLEGWEYTILWEDRRDGAYIYRVNLISDEYGGIFNQEIEVVASGNVLQILYATEFMGL
jgi:hypothetical protein